MSDILIRGVPPRMHREIQRKAASQNLSVNQLIIHWFKTKLEQEESEEEKQARLKEVFQRIRELREENFRQFGLSSDSTKLIREDRDSR